MHFRHRQTDRQTDGLASWHKRERYILHLALKTVACNGYEAFPIPRLMSIRTTRIPVMAGYGRMAGYWGNFVGHTLKYIFGIKPTYNQ